MSEPKEILPQEGSSALSNSPDEINQRIERQIEANVGYFKQQNHDAIREHIELLEKEWDIEKMLKTGLAALTVATIFLSAKSTKKWGLAAGIAGIFMAQQAAYGWSPPFAALRRLEFRTVEEIELERRAMQGLLEQPK
ncbi:hypothetical protein ACTL32_09250 [Planococcus sp. FY231025]|uniref:hypothetical protein n=1 Tax=Planococcus sp. FY231025 TaxID=3455699 RepID=UPI003F909E76